MTGYKTPADSYKTAILCNKSAIFDCGSIRRNGVLPMKVFLQNFGCKVNAIETDGIAALLVQHGWTVCTKPQDAAAIILNSCTVTASGDHRMLTALRKLRLSSPHAAIVLTGCYVQAFPQDAAELRDADILVGTKERTKIPMLLEEFLQSRTPCKAVSPYEKGDAFEALPQGTDTGHTRAFLKIQDGCNRFCAYCIIPYARGRFRSRELADIAAQANALAERGYREIVLCGINLACYGQEQGLTIADAVDACAMAGFERVRLGSLEPDGLTEEVLCRLAEHPAFCPQFHISLQSGCDKILHAMHRHYSCAEYAALLGRIRALFPLCAVTTDIMTGFPGETEEDFAQTLAFVQEMKFSKIHIFRYSRRPGTLADGMPDQVAESVKKERADRLSALEQQLHEEFLQSRIGQTVSVLFEREKDEDFHIGHAPDYTTVCIPSDGAGVSLRNRIFPVKITGVQGDRLYGEIDALEKGL